MFYMEQVIKIEKAEKENLEIYYLHVKMRDRVAMAEVHKAKGKNILLLYRAKEDQYLFHHLATALIMSLSDSDIQLQSIDNP